MAAHEKVHPVQFKLFMSGTEWQASVHDSVDRWDEDGETMDDLWEMKTEQAMTEKGGYSHVHGEGTYDSMKEHGYDPQKFPSGGNRPTILVNSNGRMIQEEGHHRVAAAAQLERETGKPMWIPTNYESTY